MKNYKIQINIDEVYRYLGYKKQPVVNPDNSEKNNNDSVSYVNETIRKQVEDCADKIINTAVPRYTYKIFNINEHLNPEGTSLRFSSDNAKLLLKECEKCIILAVTIGSKVDMLIRKAQISDMAEAVILDSCASSAAESLCNQINETLETEYLNRGLYLTDRFSPGYGDLPLSLQSGICELLSTEKVMGLSANSNLTLTPLKSITAIIGISNKPQPKRISGCGSCKIRETCKFRKEGVFCDKSTI